MPKRVRVKKTTQPTRPTLGANVEIASAGQVIDSPITETLLVNYMPYAMSVIVSRRSRRSRTSS